MKICDESGNVVIETVFGILLFGVFVFPLVTVLAEFAEARADLRTAGFNVARAWVLADAHQRTPTANEIASWYESRKSFKFTISCIPHCADTEASVQVKVRHPKSFPVFGSLIESIRLERKVHRNLQDEEHGGVTFWVIGLFLISISTVNILISVIALVERKAEVQTLADRAVLAAVNQVDFTNFYMTGDFAEIEIDSGQARSRVITMLRSSDNTAKLDSFRVNEQEVALRLSANHEMANFAGNRFIVPVSVTSSAASRSP